MLTTVAAGRVYDYGYCIGMYSQAGRGFWAPQDFVLGANGRIYVLSRGVEQLGQRVSKINFNHEFQGQFGSVGAEDGRFVWPRSIDLDRHGRVFVSDEYVNRITMYDEEGAYRYHWGRPGSEDGQLNGPSGIAFDSQGNLWVVDSLNHRVQSFSMIGEFQSRFGKRGSGDGELELPWGICIDCQDNIYVADWGNNRVQKFSPRWRAARQVRGLRRRSGIPQRAFRRSRGLGWGCIRNRLGEPPRPDLRRRRPIYYRAGRRRPRAFAVGPDLHRRQPGHHQGQAADRPGPRMAVPAAGGCQR